MKIYRHILAWLLVIGVLTLLFRRTFGDLTDAFYFVTMLLPIIAGTYYFLNYILIPRYLFPRRYARFFLYLFYTVVVSLYLEILVMLATFVFFVDYNLGRMQPYASDVIIMGIIMYLVVFAGLFVSTMIQLNTKNHQIHELDKEIKLKQRAFIEVRSQRKNVKIYHDEIRFIESLSDYICFHLNGGTAVKSREKISHIQDMLPGSFLRCHRSFIVNTAKINAFNADTITIDNNEIPVSRSFRKKVRDMLSGETESAT